MFEGFLKVWSDWSHEDVAQYLLRRRAYFAVLWDSDSQEPKGILTGSCVFTAWKQGQGLLEACLPLEDLDSIHKRYAAQGLELQADTAYPESMVLD